MGLLDIFRRKRSEPEPKRDPVDPPKGFESGVEAFCWRVLVNAYTRVLARQQGRDWMTIPDREVHAMLEPYHRDLERDARALGAAIVQARHEGMGDIQRALHRAPGLDHEMVDEAIAYAYSIGSKEGRKP